MHPTGKNYAPSFRWLLSRLGFDGWPSSGGHLLEPPRTDSIGLLLAPPICCLMKAFFSSLSRLSGGC